MIALSLAGLMLAITPYSAIWWRWIQEALGSYSNSLSFVCVGVVGMAAIPRIGYRPLMVIPWLTGLAIAGLMLQAHIPLEAERLHLVQYGLVSVVCGWAMPRHWSWTLRSLMAVGCAVGLGAIEETLQWCLPDRVGEWRDVLLDGVGGLLGRYALIPWSLRG